MRKLKEYVNILIYSFKDNIIAFVIPLLAVIGQTIHCYHLVYLVSDLGTEWLRIINAILIAMFFSLGLIFFTVKSGLTILRETDDASVRVKKREQIDKYDTAANYFQYFESFINLFYWINKLILSHLQGKDTFSIDNVPNINWFYLIITIPLAIYMPIFVRKFAGEITEQIVQKTIDDIYSKLKEIESNINGEYIMTVNEKTKNIYNITLNKNKDENKSSE